MSDKHLKSVRVKWSGTSRRSPRGSRSAVCGWSAATALAGLRFVVYSAVLPRHLSRGPLVQRVALLNGANVLTALVWFVNSVLGIGLAAWLPLRQASR